MNRIFVVEKKENLIYLEALKGYVEEKSIIFDIQKLFQKNSNDNTVNDIIIFKSLPHHLELSELLIEKGVVILDPQKVDGLEILKRIKGVAVDCGFMSKATVTPSSIDENQISVCIQRNIVTPFVKIGEQEVIIERIEGLTVYEHMSLVMAKLMLSSNN